MSLNGTRLPLPLGESRGEGICAAGVPSALSAGEGTNPVVDIGPLDSIAPGQGRAFVIAGRTIAVFRQRDGRVFATDNQCPHRGGPLAEGIVGDGKVICPLHNWKIDLATGQCVGESAMLCTYAVSVVNGRIRVNAERGARNAE